MTCEHYTDAHEGPCPICDKGTIKRVGRFICLDELGLVEALRDLPLPTAIRLKKHIEELADRGSPPEKKYPDIICPKCGGKSWGGGTDADPRPWCNQCGEAQPDREDQ